MAGRHRPRHRHPGAPAGQLDRPAPRQPATGRSDGGQTPAGHSHPRQPGGGGSRAGKPAAPMGPARRLAGRPAPQPQNRRRPAPHRRRLALERPRPGLAADRHPPGRRGNPGRHPRVSATPHRCARLAGRLPRASPGQSAGRDRAEADRPSPGHAGRHRSPAGTRAPSSRSWPPAPSPPPTTVFSTTLSTTRWFNGPAP